MKFQTLISLRFETSQGVIELRPGDTFKPKNEDAIRGLLAEGKVRFLKEVMAEKYQSLTNWLHSFDLGRDELKETYPELYYDILDAIQRLDNAFLIEDTESFRDALERIRLLYTEALFKCGRRVAVKVWSEPLQAFLWVVANDEDIKALRSQGVSEAIYTGDEIKKLKGISKDSLKEVHKAKEVFPESTIEKINNHKEVIKKDGEQT